jgi:hypothetical protein
MFIPFIPPQKLARKEHLMKEERAGHLFNPVTGMQPLIQ